jgi:hypothetical protein
VSFIIFVLLFNYRSLEKLAYFLSSSPEVIRAHNIIPIKYSSRLMPRYFHGYLFLNTGPDPVPNTRTPQVVKKFTLNPRFLASLFPCSRKSLIFLPFL